MSVFDNLVEVKRKLLRAGINLDDLPPFAITEEEFVSLSESREFATENIRHLGTGVFTVRGLQCMRGQ